MDNQMILSVVILVGGIIYVTGMYLWRRISAGETFDLQKYAETFGYVGLLAVGAYIANGVFPDFGAILAQLSQGLPDATAVMSIVSAIIVAILHQGIKKDVTSTPASQAAQTQQAKASLSAAAPVAAAPAVTMQVASPATSDQWSPGLTVTPTFSKGKSPYPIQLTVQTGIDSPNGKRCKVQLDWMDGSPYEVFSPDERTGVVVIAHTYTYIQGTTKYTGHSFYPEITALSSDGARAIESINVDGKCCEIEVQS